MPAQPRANRPFSPNGSSTSIDDLVFTLDPADKYVPLGVRRAFTTSEIRKRRGLPSRGPSNFGLASSSCASRSADDRPDTATSQYSGQALQRRRPTRSVFAKLRRSRSAGSGIKGGTEARPSSSWSRRTLSRAGQSLKAKVEEMIPAVPKIPNHILSRASAKGRPSSHKTRSHKRSASDKIASRAPTPFQKVMSNSEPTLPSLDRLRSSLPSSGSGAHSERPSTSSKRSKGFHEPCSEPFPTRGRESSTAHSCQSTVQPVLSGPIRRQNSWIRSHFPQSTFQPVFTGPNRMQASWSQAKRCDHDGDCANGNRPDQTDDLDAGHLPPASPHTFQTAKDQAEGKHHSYAESSTFSFTPSEYFSPHLTSNTTTSGRMSPIQLSQPPTPQMNGFNGDTIPFTHNTAYDIDGYYDSDSEFEVQYFGYTSQAPPSPFRAQVDDHTLAANNFPGYSLPRNEQASTTTLKKPPSLDLRPHLDHRSSTQQLVQSWNDGGEHRMGALPEMDDDLSYLSRLIN